MIPGKDNQRNREINMFFYPKKKVYIRIVGSTFKGQVNQQTTLSLIQCSNKCIFKCNLGRTTAEQASVIRNTSTEQAVFVARTHSRFRILRVVLHYEGGDIRCEHDITIMKSF